MPKCKLNGNEVKQCDFEDGGCKDKLHWCSDPNGENPSVDVELEFTGPREIKIGSVDKPLQWSSERAMQYFNRKE